MHENYSLLGDSKAIPCVLNEKEGQQWLPFVDMKSAFLSFGDKQFTER